MSRRRLAPTSLLCLALVAIGWVAPAPASGQGPGPRTSSIVAGEVGRTSIDLRATYRADATLDWDAKTIEVRSVATITNTSGGPIDYLELNSFAGALGRMEVLASKVDGEPVTVTVEDQNMRVPLGGVLPEGADTEVLIRYSARFRHRSDHPYYHWSSANGIISCLRWIPWVSRHDSFWAASWGQPYTTASSPHVRVSITSDQPLRIASTGSRVSTDGLTQVFEASDVRDFNFTAAPDFQTLSGDSLDGDTRIVVYSRTLDRQLMLDYAQQAMAAFEQRLGEYPYPRYTLTEASGGAGHESPGHVWLGPSLSDSRLRNLVVHETAHQWFYGQVGTDQMDEPFADEAVAEFLSSWFFDEFEFGGCPKDRLDKDIVYYGGCLYEVIYQQGSVFLDKIRRDIGSSRFWDALREHVEENRFDWGTTVELLETLRAHALAAGVDLSPRYQARFPSFY